MLPHQRIFIRGLWSFSVFLGVLVYLYYSRNIALRQTINVIDKMVSSGSNLNTMNSLQIQLGALPLSPAEILVVRQKTGIYLDVTRAPHLQNTILLTAANFGYLEMYKNWECHAAKLGLKWVVLAAERRAYDAIGHELAILSDRTANLTSTATKFRDTEFNRLVCTKLHDVRRIILFAQVDVVFSDCDNVFRFDPFANGVSLGDKLRSGFYEYIAQHNEAQHSWVDEPSEGNTGFYFISGTRKRDQISHLFKSALKECDSKPEIDDQTNFWHVFREMRKGIAYSDWASSEEGNISAKGNPFKSAAFCEETITFDENVLAYCTLDAYDHPVGNHVSLDGLVTFHANFITGHDNKVSRLKDLSLWNNISCKFSQNGS